MNQYNQFLSMSLLDKQAINAKQGDLINPYNNYELLSCEVDTYNNYTKDFNSMNCRARQELILDNRHKFFVTRGKANTLPFHVKLLIQ